MFFHSGKLTQQKKRWIFYNLTSRYETRIIVLGDVMSFIDCQSVKIQSAFRLSWKRASVPVPGRPYHALVFRVRGSAHFRHGDTALDTPAQTVTFMPARYFYDADYPEDNDICAFHFDSDYCGEMECFSVSDVPAVQALFERACDLSGNGTAAFYWQIMGIFCEILTLLSSDRLHLFAGNVNPAFDAAVDYLMKNYTDPDLSVEMLSELAHMSGTWFRHLFTEKYHTAPARFLLQLRLKHANTLLAAKQCSIREAALLSGFRDPKYFSRVVRREYGIPPSALHPHC